MGAVGLFFALASLGLPGLGNFVAEFLVLIGTYRTNISMTVLATLGLITATVYSLWMIHVTFFGPNKEGWKISDFSLCEMSAMAVLIISLVLFGLYPQPLFNTAEQSLYNLQKIAREYRTTIDEKETHADSASGNMGIQSSPDNRGNQ